MSVRIDVSGLDELIKQAESLATPREIEQADRKALKRCGDMVKNGVSKAMPRSKDVSRSGRKGSRTFKHSADNIPMKLTKKNGKLVMTVGWGKEDTSSYFYVKFIEFGTSRMPPVAPFKRTFIKQKKEWEKIFYEEYEKLIEKLGG